MIERRRYMGGGNQDQFIQFADPVVKQIMVQNWGGADGGSAALNTRVNNIKVSGVEGEMTYEQAASVLTINNACNFMYNTEITNLTDLKWFSNLSIIDPQSFSGCSNLTIVTIPSSVRIIRNNAFVNCTHLTKVITQNIDSWLKIGFGNQYSNPLNYALHLYSDENTEITTVQVPSDVTSISQVAFCNCLGITKVILHNSFTTIGLFAFGNCYNLSDINLPSSITTIGNQAFFYCKKLTSVVLPSNLTSLGASCFDNCTSLTSIQFPNTLTSIPNSVCQHCTSISTISIPDTVTSIGRIAFYKCALSKVIIGSGITTIGYAAFNQAIVADGELVCNAVNPPSLENLSLGSSATFDIYVPDASIEDYKAADGWSTFASKIKGLSELPS